jgi:nitrogen regulatory protein PII
MCAHEDDPRKVVSMKLITAVLQPGQFDEVVQAATDAGAHGLTATEVRGFGRQYGYVDAADMPSGRAAIVVPKLRVEILALDETAEPVVAAIAKAMNTGSIGAGKIWVSAIESVLRVRTGECDLEAV